MDLGIYRSFNIVDLSDSIFTLLKQMSPSSSFINRKEN